MVRVDKNVYSSYGAMDDGSDSWHIRILKFKTFTEEYGEILKLLILQ